MKKRIIMFLLAAITALSLAAPALADGAGSGWAQEDGIWYYYQSGQHAAGWKKIGGKWYYLDPVTGAMATGWLELDGARYYLDGSGAMKTGWQKIAGAWYYFDGSGVMATGWKKIAGKWYYLNADGVMATGWLELNGARYYLDGSGAMKTGWQKIAGAWYYFDGSGVMKTGWQKIAGKWYYLNADGVMATGWLQLDGVWYYLDSSGAMATGWKKVGGTWYYFDGSGAMATGWKKISGKWYYLNADGAMATGWKLLGGDWYYLSSSGAMVTGRQKIGGVWYTFNSSGVMTSDGSAFKTGVYRQANAGSSWIYYPSLTITRNSNGTIDFYVWMNRATVGPTTAKISGSTATYDSGFSKGKLTFSSGNTIVLTVTKNDDFKGVEEGTYTFKYFGTEEEDRADTNRNILLLNDPSNPWYRTNGTDLSLYFKSNGTVEWGAVYDGGFWTTGTTTYSIKGDRITFGNDFGEYELFADAGGVVTISLDKVGSGYGFLDGDYELY